MPNITSKVINKVKGLKYNAPIKLKNKERLSKINSKDYLDIIVSTLGNMNIISS